jgi:hypothetical protein
VAAAGELASALEITGWPLGTATKAAKQCFNAYLTRRGHLGPAETEAGVEQTLKFFALHGQSRFADPNHPEVLVRDRAGFIKDGHFWVFPQVFTHEIAQGFNARLLIDALIERGLLIPERNGKTRRRLRNPDNPLEWKRMLCFALPS